MSRHSKYALLVRYALGQWPKLASILVLTLVAAGVAALQPWPTKILIDHGLKHQPVPEWLRPTLTLLNPDGSSVGLIFVAALCTIGFFALSSAVDASLDWSWSVIGRRMANGLAVDLFQKLQRRRLPLHNRSNIGDSLNRISGDSWCVQELTAGLIISPIKNVLTLATLGVAGWQLNYKLSMLSLLLAPLLACSSWFFGRRLKARTRSVREAQSRLSNFVHQTLTAIPVVQAFGREESNRRRFEDLADDAVGWSQRRAVIDSLFGMSNGLITTAGVAAVLLVGGQQVLTGALTLGGLLIFLAYMRNLQTASEGLLGAYGALKPVEASIERVTEILWADDAIPERPDAIALPPASGVGRTVCFDNVTFGYEPGRAVLGGVSLTAQAGELIALVGETGAGKSTLASLIPRFLDPWEGSVTIDGIDIRDVQLASVRSQIALVPQEPFILPLTIAENIAYAQEAHLDQIVAAARLANAHEFIERLPQGYDTIVGQRGATLSGGEKQRLAIARAILRNSPILILDEPTSAVDAVTEASLVETIIRLKAQKTIFVIAHRLSTIRQADKIIVLDRGRIVEIGRHEELLRAGGLYRRFSTSYLDRSEEVVVA